MKYLQQALLPLLFCGCSYTATHQPFSAVPQSAASSPKSVVVVLDGETATRIDTLKNGVDSWKLDVGPTLIDVLPKVVGAQFASSQVRIGSGHSPSSDEIVASLNLKRFDVDFANTIFGRNDCEIELAATLRSPRTERTLAITGKGDGAGSDFKETYGVVIVGSMGRTGMANALGAMLTECVADAGEKLANELRRVE